MRYIDPSQLADKVAESMRNNPHEGKITLNHRLEHEHFLRMIALAPDVDVKPVVHARWIYQDGEHICSHCKGAILYELDEQGDAISEDWPWCAKCGAKMDAEGGTL